MTELAYEVLRDLAAQDPITDADYGQGGRGRKCRFCHADDWGGDLVHDQNCVWLRAKQEVG